MSKFKSALATAGAVIVSIMPFASQAAETVRIESQANVANVTGGVAPQYHNSVNAKVDDVVRVEVWYHNKEIQNSGKIAENLRVKIDAPLGVKGKTQIVRSTVSAQNSNTVKDTATINLASEAAYLEYIPGTAKWRHNAGTNANPNYVTERIGDGVVTNANGVVVENAKPCFNFEATVTAEFRVRMPNVHITKQVRKLGEKDWLAENTAKPGDVLEYRIRFINQGNVQLKNVVIGDKMPPRITYVPGTTMLANTSHPQGIKITSDNVAKGGIDVGHYDPGSVGYVWFQAKIDENLEAGDHTFKNVGVVQPEGMNEFFSVAITKVVKAVVQQPPVPTPPTPGQLAPEQIPVTGPETAAAGMLGTGALGYAVRGYIRSRKALLLALLGK